MPGREEEMPKGLRDAAEITRDRIKEAFDHDPGAEIRVRLADKARR